MAPAARPSFATTLPTAAAADRVARAARVATALAWLVVLVAALEPQPLLPVDETRYATVAWEMHWRGDWLVPHLNGEPYSHKPPLLFWLVRLGWMLVGVGDAGLRLVGPLAAGIGLLLVARLARALWPERPETAWAAPLLLGGMLVWPALATRLYFDSLLATCVLLALDGTVRAWRTGSAAAAVETAVGTGLALLAKGPVALVPILAVVFAAPWWGRDAPPPGGWRRGGVRQALAFAGGLAILGAWALPAAWAGGPEYREMLLVRQTAGRVVESFAHARPFWWYLPVLPAVLLPISLWPPLGRALRGAGGARGVLAAVTADAGLRLCVAWGGLGLGVLSLVDAKQPHYLLPLVPAFALAAARLAGPALAAPARGAGGRFLAIAALVLGALLLAAAVVGPQRVPAWDWRIAPIAAGAVLALGALAWRTGLPVAVPTALAAPIAVALLELVYVEAAGRAVDLSPTAAVARATQESGAAFGWLGAYHGELNYLGRLRRPVEEVHKPEAAAWLREHPGGVLVGPYETPPGGLGAPAESRPYRGERLGVWRSPAAPP